MWCTVIFLFFSSGHDRFAALGRFHASAMRTQALCCPFWELKHHLDWAADFCDLLPNFFSFFFCVARPRRLFPQRRGKTCGSGLPGFESPRRWRRWRAEQRKRWWGFSVSSADWAFNDFRTRAWLISWHGHEWKYCSSVKKACIARMRTAHLALCWQPPDKTHSLLEPPLVCKGTRTKTRRPQRAEPTPGWGGGLCPRRGVSALCDVTKGRFPQLLISRESTDRTETQTVARELWWLLRHMGSLKGFEVVGLLFILCSWTNLVDEELSVPSDTGSLCLFFLCSF